MSRLTFFAAILCLVSQSFLLAKEQKKPHPQESLDTAIAHAIKLLEAKEYKKVIDSFLEPEELKKLKESGKYDAVVEKFADKKGKHFLGDLKQCQNLKPEFNDEKTLATFKASIQDNGLTRRIVFKKHGKRWYIKN